MINPKPPCPSSSSAGFTLLEVLVALIILGLAVAFLTGTITDSLARAERTRQEDHAAILADNILAHLGRDVPLTAGISTGSDAELGWRLVISPVSPAAIIPLDQIDLTITSLASRTIGHWVTLRVARRPT